jgi:hypothetical protein
LTADAWKELLEIRYDFDYSIDFSISDFNKAVNSLGAIHQKVLTGNYTGTHAREKFFPRFNEDGKKVGTQKITFLFLASSKDTEPHEPKTKEDWKPALKVSQDIVDDTRRKSIRVSSFCERASSQSLGPVDVEITKLRQRTSHPSHPIPVSPPPTLSSPPSTSYWDTNHRTTTSKNENENVRLTRSHKSKSSQDM